ncbi:2-C-methyl-D-erythritol 4-phosphate cytidylyltransferase [Adhaeribacter rhizoryzae]|uniref:2-C-methyl-D-erythritol 4-phosphate cytidylyltransferase n=1 Tax=Adhaeribacter rhizoryzae TaxID=2607907 RepID=A0A5M6DD75_9BACT|nr:2-C-methyl-D-erythritol 4-phosphate cytidylyltransferase [Adhaeribacter rhizoryzae]KAA5544232.1 2-C-methyl-D-erythritol 4-phosphate cytidylyltransferase [Adhaeribacter rhizoryzae]
MAVELPEAAILVAGGTGSRMQSEVPKQFIAIGGQPILMHTIRRFYEYNPQIKLVVVLPQNQIAKWQALCYTHVFEVKHEVVTGGATRFASVKNGLAAIKTSDGIVAVHDGVRPFVPVAIIKAAFAVAAEKGNAVVAVPLKESIRQVFKTKSKALDRSQFRLVQTPQCFRLPLFRRAYELPEEPTFTDDASVVERFGQKINLVAGSYDNIKITTPEDLLWAEVFLKSLG